MKMEGMNSSEKVKRFESMTWIEDETHQIEGTHQGEQE